MEIIKKLQRRQSNWKLDPPLRKACKADVGELCAAENAANAENGTVYACLLRNIDDLDPGCRKEMGRAYHMALYIWAPGAILTTACDDDVARCAVQRGARAGLWLRGGGGLLAAPVGRCCSQPPAALLLRRQRRRRRRPALERVGGPAPSP